LAPLASLTGQCEQAEQLARLATPPTYRVAVSEHVAVAARVLLARSALGCPESRSSPRLAEVAAALARDPAAVRLQERQYLDARLLFRAALYATPLDSAVIDRVAESTGHPLLRAARALTRHDSAQVRSTLSEFRNQMRVSGAPWTPDMEFPGASLLFAVGDTLASLEWLDGLLEETRGFNPTVLWDPARSAAFIRATVLRADLAIATGDSVGARRWATVAATLWRDGDAGLSGVARRMARYAGIP
jgi:hypothetical protein